MNLSWRQETLYLLVMAMEAAWLAPLLALFSNYAGGQPLPAWALAALYLAAFWTSRLVLKLDLDALRSRILVVYLAATTMLVAAKFFHYAGYSWTSLTWLVRLAADLFSIFRAVPPVALTVAAGVYLWWRGLTLTAERMTPGTVAFRFKVGLAAFVAVLVLAAFLPLEDVSSAVFTFFFFGLLAVAIARLEDVTSGKASSLDGYWLSVLLVATVAVLILGSVAVSALASSVSILAWLLGLLRPVFDLLGQLVYLLLIPLGYLLEFFVNLLRSLLRGMRLQEPVLQPTPGLGDLLEQAQRSPGLPPELVEIIRAVAVIALLLLAGWVVARAVGGRLGSGEEGLEEIREFVWSPGGFWSDLTAFFSDLWQRIKGTARQRAGTLSVAFRGEERRSALSIRQIYGALLRLAASLGSPRRPDQTPYEYLPDLSRVLPDATGDVAAITDAYVRVRYSPWIPTREEAQEVRQAWHRIRRS